MNWFKGSIAEAVTSSKERNATFVVYVEGKDDNSAKLTGFLNEPMIRNKLERDCFVAIKIEGGSDAYMQFAKIYQIVPLPSLFFIGKNGTPLEIATGVIASSDELDRKIENVLRLTGENKAASASADFIAGEQKREIDASKPTTSKEVMVEPQTESKPVEDSKKNEEVKVIEEPKTIEKPKASEEPKTIEEPTTLVDNAPSASTEPVTSIPTTKDTGSEEQKPSVTEKPKKTLCSDAICFAPAASWTNEFSEEITPPTAPHQANEPSRNPIPQINPITNTIPTSSTVSSSTIQAATRATSSVELEQAQQLIEERKKLKKAEEDRQERERELNRRKEGKNAQQIQNWQKETDFKEVKESMRRDKLEDERTRQRIREQIASDRAERAQKFASPLAPATPPTQPSTPTTVNQPSNSEVSRIQFRIPNGETSSQTFESSDTFATVQAYVKGEVIKGTGIKNFTLAKTFPKHEFTAEDDSKTLTELGLCPSAVILVITKASTGPSAVVARSGGIINIFNTVFWAFLSPVIAVFGYIRNFIIGGGADPRPAATTGAQKRANEERTDANDMAKKRNLDRFSLSTDGPSTSQEAMETAKSAGGAYRRVGGSNIHRLSDQRKDSDDENNTWNGNSTQQQ